MFRCRFGLCLLLTIFYILLFVSRPASAADVSGIIDTDTTWTVSESPYRVVGNVRVSEEATLTIDPGVTVTLQAQCECCRRLLPFGRGHPKCTGHRG